jgi:glycosyltransferase involved in cell wall biosynthesis
MKVAIVTPVFNRADSMHRSLLSSLALVNAGIACQLVVVDDASTDDSVCQIKSKYSAEIADGKLILVELPKNLGVSGAKNAGAVAAAADWIIFMDSDDWFVPAAVGALCNELNQHPAYAAVFFRCQDQTSGQLVGRPAVAEDLTLTTLVNTGTPGECLPVVRRADILAIPYPTELRGSEGLTYLAMLHSGRKIYLSDIIAREYDNSGADRLSSRQGLRKRAGYLVRHNLRSLRYARYARPKTVAGWLIRIVYYSGMVIMNKISRVN